MSPKQNGIRLKNTYVKILTNSGASALIIHESYVNRKNFITRKNSTDKWSTLAGSFSTLCKAEITLKMAKLNVTAHISASFHVITKKVKKKIVIVRDLLWELGFQLDFQNNFIGWQDINLHMKPIDCKMRTHLIIQDSENVRKATKRIKKILDTNYEKANLNKIKNNLKYLNNNK